MSSCFIQTRKVMCFDPLHPNEEDIHIEDIAWSLAQKVRFSGFGSRFYSIAEHSIHVSQLCPPQYAFAGLLHDAAEAYLFDVPTPLKANPALHSICDAINRLQHIINGKYGVVDLERAVKPADLQMLRVEAEALIGPLDPEFRRYLSGIPVPVRPVLRFADPETAYEWFLETFEALESVYEEKCNQYCPAI